MKLLLLIAGVSFCTLSFDALSQSTTLPKTNLNGTEVYDTLTASELTNFYQAIDQMGISELKKYRESFVYRRRHNPCVQNIQIVVYIDEKIITLQP